jgi:hypothetical protein
MIITQATPGIWASLELIQGISQIFIKYNANVSAKHMANNAAASAKITDLHPIHLLVPEFYTCGSRQALRRAYDDALVVLRGEL